MRIWMVPVFLCLLLTACQSTSMAIMPTASAAAPTSKPTAAPTQTYKKEIRTTLCDELDWKLPDGRIIKTELWHIFEKYSVDQFDSHLRLTLSADGFHRIYELEDNGPLPPYYLYPCNVTGGGRELFVSKGTTSLGVEIWTYELFTLDEENELVLLFDDDEDGFLPRIPVRKETTENGVKIYAMATELNDERLLIDYSNSFENRDRLGCDIYGMEEGESIAVLERHQQIVPEDSDGDGRDELRCQYNLGLYREWYGYATAWFSYRDGEWEVAKLLLESSEGDVPLQIPAREIVMEGAIPIGVKGLRVGSPIREMYDRLGDPHTLYSYTYRYAVDDGTWLLIESEASRIARFTLARP